MNRCPIYAIPTSECNHCQRAANAAEAPNPHPTIAKGSSVAQSPTESAAIAITDSVDYPPKPTSWRQGLGNGSGECAKCRRWWTGANTCHCPACHENFTGITAFDKHRAGSHTHSTRHCVDPETILDRNGERVLVDAGRAYPCWGFRGADTRWGE